MKKKIKPRYRTVMLGQAELNKLNDGKWIKKKSECAIYYAENFTMEPITVTVTRRVRVRGKKKEKVK